MVDVEPSKHQCPQSYFLPFFWQNPNLNHGLVRRHRLCHTKKDTRQAQPQSNGGSIGQGQQQQGQQQQLEPIETIIQLVMTQQMIEAQKVTRALRIHLYPLIATGWDISFRFADFWIELTLVMFHPLAQVLNHFCQFDIKQSQPKHRVEKQKSSQQNPAPQADGQPCHALITLRYKCPPRQRTSSEGCLTFTWDPSKKTMTMRREDKGARDS